MPPTLTGELEALLQAYDRERRALPSPVVMWQWGWTRSAETWNGWVGLTPHALRMPHAQNLGRREFV